MSRKAVAPSGDDGGAEHPELNWGLSLQETWRRKYRIQMETRRCLLRPFIEDDLDWLTDLLVDREVNHFLWDGVKSRDEAKRTAEGMIFLDLNRLQFGHWAIQDKSTGVIHGWTALGNLRPWSGPSDEIAVSYVLRRASWGQGLATETAGFLVRHAFEVHGLDTIMAVIVAGNIASKRVLEKIGMHFVQSSNEADGTTLEYFRINASTPAARALQS